MSEPRYCLQCDDGTELVYGTRDLPIALEGLQATVTQVAGWHCPACGDCHFDAGEAERYQTQLQALRQQLNLQRAAALRATRKKLGLRQIEAGLLFGGGASAFSEYERGKTQPHKSTLLLFKLLDRHPELLNEIRAG